MVEIASSNVEKDFILNRYDQLNYPVGFMSKYTSNQLPRFGSIYPDWYEEHSKTAGFVHGCEVMHKQRNTKNIKIEF